MERVFHNLSKGARYDILSILLERRGKKELATELGVSPALITKYINKVTHPSDEVMSKIYEISQEDERKRINRIIINDMVESLLTLVQNVDIEEIADNEELKKLKEILSQIENHNLLRSFSFV
ncbi:helix-turn-helix transcriptional regulator [Sulfuracidifex metallicus]|uniref:Helix-turn-helix domain-containing protein n=1 Tax=Sulfuracidifex metallicus DSM 6482 = JCM 9184 TaxID=523847 RepID=A0A6A9QNK5_SULME|nr:helix-turn-helix domain-containing protein [Sulfuracidifex metallicus DSM 6482 = JCM 9184]WOE50722.1 helix-turn-helix transcriptional regulator [Sulfuracidifex metallicus DSM 6482 = JCM 9184]